MTQALFGTLISAIDLTKLCLVLEKSHRRPNYTIDGEPRISPWFWINKSLSNIQRIAFARNYRCLRAGEPNGTSEPSELRHRFCLSNIYCLQTSWKEAIFNNCRPWILPFRATRKLLWCCAQQPSKNDAVRLLPIVNPQGQSEWLSTSIELYRASWFLAPGLL